MQEEELVPVVGLEEVKVEWAGHLPPGQEDFVFVLILNARRRFPIKLESLVIKLGVPPVGVQ